MSVPVFVDTSAFYGVLAADDRRHADALAGWERLLEGLADQRLEAVVHGGIVVESAALVQRRLGAGAVRDLLVDLLPLCTTVWVDADLHAEAAAALVAAGRREVSLVDWTSFIVMQRRGINRAFAFDSHFVEQGFELFR